MLFAMKGNAKHVDWQAIKMEFAANSTLTVAELARKYGVPPSTVRWRCWHYDWMQERSDYQAKVATRLTQLATSKDAVAMLRDVNDKQLKQNEELRYMLNSRLKTRGADGKITVKSDVSIPDIARAVAAFTELYRCDRLALGASTENLQPAAARDRFADMSDEELVEELKRVRARNNITIN
jgi:hypothetical protein